MIRVGDLLVGVVAVDLPHDEDFMNLSRGECHGPSEKGLWGRSTRACSVVGMYQQVVYLGYGCTLKVGLTTHKQTSRELLPIS